ncbi:MAG: hypothetical protein ABII12_05950 [Planctomycetota bacterium]
MRVFFILAAANFLVNAGLLGYQCVVPIHLDPGIMDAVWASLRTRHWVSLFMLFGTIVMCFIPRFRCARTYVALLFLVLSLPAAIVLSRQ